MYRTFPGTHPPPPEGSEWIMDWTPANAPPPPPGVHGVQIRKSPNPLKTIVKSHFGHHMSPCSRYLTIFDQKVREFAVNIARHKHQGRKRKMHNVHELPTWHHNNNDTKPKRATRSQTKKIMHNISVFLFF